MTEAKIFKFSGYAIDTIDPYSKEQIEDSICDWCDDQGLRCVRHLHVEEADLSDNDIEELMDKNCDLSYCEKHFHKQASAVIYDRPIPQPGEHWKHFKVGKVVKILAVSRCTEAPDSFSVIYCGKYGIVWDRPLDMFMSEVDHEKYPDSKEKYRFSKVEGC